MSSSLELSPNASFTHCIGVARGPGTEPGTGRSSQCSDMLDRQQNNDKTLGCAHGKGTNCSRNGRRYTTKCTGLGREGGSGTGVQMSVGQRMDKGVYYRRKRAPSRGHTPVKEAEEPKCIQLGVAKAEDVRRQRQGEHA